MVLLSFSVKSCFRQGVFPHDFMNMARGMIQCKVKQNNGEPKVINSKSAKNHLRGTTGLRVRPVLRHDGCYEAGFLV